jgi:predicted PurR-regulated permease PerM
MNARHWWHEQEWSNRRILFLLAVGTFIVSVIWHLPSEFDFISHHLGEIIIALVLALGFTYTLRPAVNATERVLSRSVSSKKMQPRSRRTLATTLVFFGVIGLVWGFANIGLKPVALDARNFWHSFMAHSPEERQEMISRWENSLNRALKPYQSILPAGTLDNIESAIPNAIDSAQSKLSAWAMRSFSHLGLLVELILVPVLVFYFLADGRALRDELKLLCPQKWCARVSRMMGDLDRVLDGYIRGQVIMCLIAWVLVTIGLLILGVPHPFALGILAGLTRAVPIIGPLLGAIPLALVCLLFTQSLETTGVLLALFTAMHFLESKVLLPKIIGHEVDLHPVSVIITLLLGMELFGFVGVILAVPIAALIKILLIEARYDKRTNEAESTLANDETTLASSDLIPETQTLPSSIS